MDDIVFSVVKSASRALQIVDMLTAAERSMTSSEIAIELSIPRSSLHALLLSLIGAGWLEHDRDAHTYRLGIRALEAGSAYSRSLTVLDRIRLVAEALRDELHETVQVSVLEGRYNVYIARYDGGQLLSLISEIGRRIPAHATGLGKMLLSDLSDAEFDRLFDNVRLERFTASTIGNRVKLAAHLAEIRGNGYSLDLEERTRGVHCIAVPLRDATQRIFAAISVSAPGFRFGPEEKARTLTLLLSASRELSRTFGARLSLGRLQVSPRKKSG